MVLLLDEKEKLDEVSEAASTSLADDPPPYVSGPVLPDDDLTPDAPLPVSSKPVNRLLIMRMTDPSPIRETFVVDPELDIPLALLPPLPSTSDGERNTGQNLHVESKYGSIDADIWVAPGAAAQLRAETARSPVSPLPRSPAGGTPPKASLEIRSEHGSISIALHTQATAPATFHLTASTQKDLSVLLPRTFRGPLITRGPVTLSDELRPEVAVLQEVDGHRRCWVGSYHEPSSFTGPPSPPASGSNSPVAEESSSSSTAWPDTSSEVQLETTRGKIFIGYEDELHWAPEPSVAGPSVSPRNLPVPPMPPSPFGRVWGGGRGWGMRGGGGFGRGDILPAALWPLPQIVNMGMSMRGGFGRGEGGPWGGSQRGGGPPGGHMSWPGMGRAPPIPRPMAPPLPSPSPAPSLVSHAGSSGSGNGSSGSRSGSDTSSVYASGSTVSLPGSVPSSDGHPPRSSSLRPSPITSAPPQAPPIARPCWAQRAQSAPLTSDQSQGQVEETSAGEDPPPVAFGQVKEALDEFMHTAVKVRREQRSKFIDRFRS